MPGINERERSRYLNDLLREVGSKHDWRNPLLIGAVTGYTHLHETRYRQMDDLVHEAFVRAEPHASDLIRMVEAAILGIVCAKTFDDGRLAQTWVTGLARACAIAHSRAGNWQHYPQSGQLNWVGFDAIVRLSDTIWASESSACLLCKVEIDVERYWEEDVRRAVMWSPIWKQEYWKPGCKTEYRKMSVVNRGALGCFIADYAAREALQYASDAVEELLAGCHARDLWKEARWGPYPVNASDDDPVIVARAH